MTDATPAAVERLADEIMRSNLDYTEISDTLRALAAQLEAIHAQGYAKGLRDAAACLGHITRFEDLDAILALIPADLPAPDNRIAEYEKSYQYALNLADCLVKHYPDAVKDGWRPLGDLLGLLTQIDNMVAELIPADTPAAKMTVQDAARVLLGDEYTSPLLEVLDAYNNDYDVGQDVLKALRAIAGEKP
jgi:hypothetical protein